MIWKKLTDTQQFITLVEDSRNNHSAFGVFKHSTRCGISLMALKQFEKSWPGSTDIEVYYLDLLQHRDISNLIEKVTGVTHQSPQFIVIENGEVSYHGSHSWIDADEAVNSIAN